MLMILQRRREIEVGKKITEVFHRRDDLMTYRSVRIRPAVPAELESGLASALTDNARANAGKHRKVLLETESGELVMMKITQKFDCDPTKEPGMVCAVTGIYAYVDQAHGNKQRV